MKLIRTILTDIEETETEHMNEAAQRIASAIAVGNIIWIYGASHAGILAQELSYRAGALANVSPIVPYSTIFDSHQACNPDLESLLECPDEALSNVPVNAGDVLIVHSVSGSSQSAISVAQWGKKKGMYVIALTSLEHATSEEDVPTQSLKLHQIADLVLDNHVPTGDASIPISETSDKAGPVSTVIGVAVMHAILSEVALKLAKLGIQPNLFKSVHIVGGEEHNKALAELFKGRVMYL